MSRAKVWADAWNAVAAAENCMEPRDATRWADTVLKNYDTRFDRADEITRLREENKSLRVSLNLTREQLSRIKQPPQPGVRVIKRGMSYDEEMKIITVVDHNDYLTVTVVDSGD